MNNLILVRLGQSEWNLENRFTGWVDVGLAAKGKLEACKAGELIKELNLELSYFYTSLQTRSIETLNLILVRHGQSVWNLENRFTGWVDVGLAAKGKLEACKAGELIKELNLELSYFYTSLQTRSIETLNLILNTMRIKDQNVVNAWELNERHYGALTGLNKDEMKKLYGEEKIHTFRRSWDNPPEPLKKTSPYHPVNIDIYKNIPKDKIPDTESLKNTYERVIPFYKKTLNLN